MIKSTLIIGTFTVMTSLATASWAASDSDSETIYGSQLMTQQERLEYRQKHMNAKTAQEREEIQQEHHALMQQRAKERNIKLPDAPPARGMGGGMGGGMNMDTDSDMQPGQGSDNGMGAE